MQLLYENRARFILALRDLKKMRDRVRQEKLKVNRARESELKDRKCAKRGTSRLQQRDRNTQVNLTTQPGDKD